MAMNETYPAALAVGTELKSQVATYRITQVLGQGGCGITYKAEIPSIGTKHTYFAIKELFIKDGNARQGNQVVVLPGKEAVVQSMKERFWREVERLSMYDHPNIVKVADRMEANNTLYYVMDFLPGGSLDAFKKPMAEERLTRYILDVVDVLQYLHSQQVNHLDVKPENIMLDEQDNVILIDFGISQGYTASGERTTVFSTRGVSKGYSAPEYGKEDSFSPALDVYSLGATLYRLSTGDLPPDIQDVEQLTFPDFVSSRMKSIIKEAMHHCVDRRSSLEDLRYSLLSLMTSSDFSQSNDTNETEVDIIASKDSKWEVVKSFVQDIYNSRKLMSLFKNDALGFLMFFGFYCGIFYCINYDQIDPPLGHLFYIQITLLTLVMPVKHYVWLLYKCLFDTHIRDFSRLDWAYLIWVCILLIGYISMIYIFAFDSLILLYKMLSQMCVYLYNKYLC